MSPSWLHPFLLGLSTTGIVSKACVSAGISNAAVYALRKRDADFAAAWDDALEQAWDVQEAEAHRRAVVGVEEPVVYQGQLTPLWERDEAGQIIHDTVMRSVFNEATKEVVETAVQVPRQELDEHGRPRWLTVRKYSDPLLIALLKANRKKFSTDRMELTGANGGPVQMNDTERSARIAQIVASAQQRKQQAEDFSDLA